MAEDINTLTTSLLIGFQFWTKGSRDETEALFKNKLTEYINHQLSQSLEAYNRECKRVDELTEEVDKGKEHVMSLYDRIQNLESALQYYYDVLREVRGENWHERPDHVTQKFIAVLPPKKKIERV